MMKGNNHFWHSCKTCLRRWQEATWLVYGDADMAKQVVMLGQKMAYLDARDGDGPSGMRPGTKDGKLDDALGSRRGMGRPQHRRGACASGLRHLPRPGVHSLLSTIHRKGKLRGEY